MKADIRVIHKTKQATRKIASEPPEAWEKHEADSLESSEGNVDTLISEFQFSELWENKFLLFKPSSLQYFANTALMNTKVIFPSFI